MSFSPLSAPRMRFVRLKFSLVVLALVAPLLPIALNAQQTFTGGGAISVGSTQTTGSSSTLTIAGATGSSIATLKIVLNGVTSNGQTGFSLQPTVFYLQAPHGGPSLVLLGGTGDGIDGDDLEDAGSGLDNVTITIEDGATAAPDGNPSIWPHTGSITVEPSSYFVSDGFSSPLGSAADWPQTDGSATLTASGSGRFIGTGINNGDEWTLTIQNGDDDTTTPVSISSWEMIVTYGTTTPTSTTVSSSLNPAFTTSTVTLTATVTGSGATGTVAFEDNGVTISGCGAAILSGGKATCNTTLAQGYHPIDAIYSGGGGFGGSSGSLTQLIEVHPTQSSNTWCNNSSFSAVLNGTPIAYPAMIPISGYPAGTTVGNVTLELEGVTQGAAGTGIDAEFLLVGPGGTNNLDFLDTAFNTEGTNVNLFISDAATLSPDGGTAVSGDTYLPYDGNIQTIDAFPPSNSPIVDSNIPLVPGTINYAAPHGKTNSFTLQQAFSGAPANGDWALYATASNGTDALTVGGWCISLDVNTGTPTTTTLSSSQQDAFTGANVTLSATVVINGTSTPVTTGTVEFKDVTTGTVLASAAALNGSGVATAATSALTEGDHKIIATYSGNATFDTSFATLYQRIDHATAITAVNSNTWRFCNPGAITIPMGTSGAETPNPSNIFVSNLPGTLNTATLSLNNFSILVGDQLDNTESLVVGPTGAALDFFSNTADGTISDEALAGNYTFADSAATLVSSGSGNITPGTYLPTSYVGTDNANDVFTADAGGFFTLPGTFGYSASRGTSTFDTEFGGSNANGTWSLYFNSPNANANGTGAAGGWCLNLTENLPAVTAGLSSASTFTQGGSGAYTVTVQNNGTGGPTGDPTGANPMTVTDVLNAAFTFASGSGTGWSCSASGQTVTCKNDSAVADNGGAYPDLTINVTVSGTATGVIPNQVSAAGAGASSTNSTIDNVTIEVPLVITSAASTTFTVGAAGSFTVTATGTPVPTFSETGALPGGVTLSGTGALSGTPAAGSGGSYPITITASNGVSANATQNFTLTVNQAPAITTASSTTFTVGTAGTFTVTATGFPAAAFSATGALPSGVTLSSTGILSGTPAAGSGGSYPITITASNGVGSNATQDFILTVDQAPAITSASSTTFTVGAAGSFTVTATSFPSPTFGETGALPSGVTFLSSGILSGTAAAGSGGTYPITITASNGVTPNATQSFTLTVDQPPAITSASSATFTVGTAGSFSVTRTGFPSPVFSETGALPTGVTFSGAGLLSGTPAAGSGGSYPITITASNGVGSNATQDFILTVDQAPSITSANSAAFTVGTSGSFTVTSSSFPTATFSETGALPAGLTFSAAGLLSGTPTGTSGSYPITITASNGVGTNATQSFTITVNAGPATHLVIPGGPEPFYTAFSFTISAYDAVGNLATSYNGTVAFTSSDPGFVNLGPVTLVNGTATATAVLKTAGVDTITATDISNPSITGTGSFTIQPGVATHFGVSAPPSSYAGSPFNFTVTAFDLYGNIATGYTGTATFTSTDGAATLPAPSVLTAGVGTFPATLKTAGSQTITATDSVNGVAGTSGAIAVTIPNLVVNAIADDAGTASNCTVQAAPGSNTVDSACSLRDALLEAASIGSGTITFDSTAFAAPQTITLTNGTLTIPPNTTIAGPTTGSGFTLTNLVTVSGAGSVGVFSHTSGSAAISGLIVTDGNSGNGGGVYNGPGAAFTISNSTISGNSAGYGGGLYNWGSMSVSNCAIFGNTASQEGGGILTQGSALTVNNSTISGNAAASGGGIINLSGAATLTNTTISNNSATVDGGGVASQASLILTNTIISGNTSSGTNPNVPSGYTDDGGSLVNSSTINLAPLGNYGGPTKTMPALPASPAICAIDPSAATGNDQRGLPRTTTYGSFTCQDSGAVQSNYSLTFSADPPSTVSVLTNFTAAVTLDESGFPFVVTATPLPAVTIPLTLTGTGTLTGGSVAIDDATGIATYPALEVSLAGNNDTLTANLTLNPAVTPTPLVISATSSQFDAELTSTTTTATSASATYSETAQNVALSATVTSTAGTVNAGTVTFAVFQGVTQIGISATSGTVTNGAANATFVLPAGIAAGTYTIQATYSGSSTLAGSSDSTHTLVVSPASTTTAGSNVATAYSTSAQSVTLAATVTSPAGAVNAGTVTFTVLQGVTPVGAAVTSATVLNGAASVSYTLPAGTPAAVYSIQAVYNGTVSLSTSSDASHSLTVSTTATTTSAANAAATFNTAAQNVALTASVTSLSGPVNAGTVTFTLLQGAAPVGIAVTSSTVVNGAASAIYVLPAGTPAGAYTIQAAYSGAASLVASSDNTHTLTVGKATATVTLGSLTQTYTGSPLSATATTAPTGLTVNFTYNASPTPPTTVGSYTVVGTISNANYQGSATGTLVITQATPTVTWPALAAITYGMALSATQLDASSTLPGTFAYNPAAGIVLGAGAHTLTVTFTPADTTDYTNASASVTLQVNQATPAITWANPAAITYGTALSATQLDATSTVAGIFAYSPAVGTTLTAGTHTLSVTLTPTDAVDYTTASATVTLTVNQATPAITWANPAAITYGAALSATQLDATSTVAGTFAYNPAAGTVPTAGSHPLSVTLTPTDTADYTIATATVTLLVNQATPAITWASPAAITYGTALGATQLDATSTVAGTFAYTPAAGTVLAAGTHTLSVTLTPTDSTDYTTATASVTIIVNQAAPAIVWPAPTPIVYGTALGAAQLDASSAVAGSFTYNPASGTVLTAGPHTLNVTFTPTDTADYTTATASVTIAVNQATPPIVWAAPASITYGTALGATQLDASSTVAGTFAYNPASGTVLAAGSHTLSVTFTPTDTADYTTATASVTLVVNNEPQTITLSASTLADASGATFGPTPLILSATASSGLPVVFSLLSGPATLSGNALTINGAGTVVIAANQPGNSNYAAAPQVTENILVNKALPIAALASSVNPVLVENGITFTATVTSGAGTPTGTVTFMDGATALGTGTLSGGVATFATSSLAAGSHAITAAYNGDTNFLASTSSVLTEQAEDFGFTISSQTATVLPGGTAVFTFTVSPIDGTTFPAAITFTAAGLPAGATYTFSPASVTAGESSTTVTLTIDVSQAQAGIDPANLRPNIQRAINNAGNRAGSHGKSNHGVASALAPFALALILLPFAGRLRRAGKKFGRALSMLMMLAAGMAAIAGIGGCGSTSGFFAQQQQSYTVTVTGTSGSLTHSATVTLTVQ
jgi:MBG domain/Bacterial Ig-like domain (group 3)/Putative Ig domain